MDDERHRIHRFRKWIGFHKELIRHRISAAVCQLHRVIKSPHTSSPYHIHRLSARERVFSSPVDPDLIVCPAVQLLIVLHLEFPEITFAKIGNFNDFLSRINDSCSLDTAQHRARKDDVCRRIFVFHFPA